MRSTGVKSVDLWLEGIIEVCLKMTKWPSFLHRDQQGQAGLEYMLAGGTIALALALALFGLRELMPEFVGHECAGVDTAANPAPTHKSCVVESP